MTIVETPVEAAAVVDAAQRWQTLLACGTTDPVERARIDAAGDLADATLAGAARGGWLRPRPAPHLDPVAAGETWARVALLWHTVLTDTDAFIRARTDPTLTCHLDPSEVRDWLTSFDGGTTVGQRLLGDEFGLSAFHKWGRITTLVAQAQQAGVLHVPGHRIDLLHLANDRGFIDRHRVTLTVPMHGTLCSPDIDTLDLLTDHLDGVDAAVHLLTVVAEETDHLLAQRALLADIPPPTRTPGPVGGGMLRPAGAGAEPDGRPPRAV